jgi:hypothetical protein
MRRIRWSRVGVVLVVMLVVFEAWLLVRVWEQLPVP